MSDDQLGGMFTAESNEPPSDGGPQDVSHDDNDMGDESTEVELSQTQDDQDDYDDEPQQQVEQQRTSLEENYKRALSQERAERQRLAQELQTQQHQAQEYQRQWQQYQEQARQQEQAYRQQQQQQEQVPDPEEDPIGYNNWAIQKLAEHAAKQQEYIDGIEQQKQQYFQQQQQQARQQHAMQQFVGNYENHARAFMQENPDFKDAYKYLQQSRMAEYQAAGYDWNQAQALLVDDEAAIVAKAMQDGINPAQRIYELSKIRGFSQARPRASHQNHQIETQREGIKRQGLRGGGGAVSSRRSADNVDTMSDSEFEKLWADMERSSRRAG